MATDARYQSEPPEETRLYDDRNPVCRYYHITRRTAVLQTLAEVSGMLPNPITFVDLGCGSGTYLRATQAFFQTRIGVDLALHKLRFARNSAQADSSRYVTASVLEVPLETGCADVILCSEVLEHFPEPGLVIAEVARIARPGGFVIISSPARADLIALAKSVFGSGPSNSRRLERADMHGHYWYFAPSHLVSMITAAGFGVRSVRAEPKVHFRGLPTLLRWRLVSDRLMLRIASAFKRSVHFRTVGAFAIVLAQRV